MKDWAGASLGVVATNEEAFVAITPARPTLQFGSLATALGGWGSLFDNSAMRLSWLAGAIMNMCPGNDWGTL